MCFLSQLLFWWNKTFWSKIHVLFWALSFVEIMKTFPILFTILCCRAVRWCFWYLKEVVRDDLSKYSCYKTCTETCNRSSINIIAKKKKGNFGTKISSPVCFKSVCASLHLFHGWVFGSFQEVNHRQTSVHLLVLGKEFQFHSWVSSMSNLKPICERPTFWVKILQHRSISASDIFVQSKWYW